MDSQAPGNIWMVKWRSTTQRTSRECLSELCALNSTVSYALETLVQHQTLIGQLQDEVDALRSQNEDLQRRLE
jgi:hypothetical protein